MRQTFSLWFNISFIVVGVVGLWFPVIGTPQIYPTWICFLPYVGLMIGLLFLRDNSSARVLLMTSAAVSLLGTCVYLDAARLNWLFSWNVFGIVQTYLPLAELCCILPLLIVLLCRRLGKRHV